jgi:hypothetical protein
MPYLATLNAGLSNVSLPNGLIASGGQATFLTDEQFAALSPTGKASLFATITAVNTATTVPTTTVGAQTPQIYGYLINGVWTLDNPYVEAR